MTGRPGLHLTRRAALDLRDIHRRSVAEWGTSVAARYMNDLYAAMNGAAADPEIGLLRQHRAAPFLMVAARKHFVVYERFGHGIAVLTLLHQSRDIESLIAEMTQSFFREIDRLKGGGRT
jgi:toxin ParE1/3/4